MPKMMAPARTPKRIGKAAERGDRERLDREDQSHMRLHGDDWPDQYAGNRREHRGDHEDEDDRAA